MATSVSRISRQNCQNQNGGSGSRRLLKWRWASKVADALVLEALCELTLAPTFKNKTQGVVSIKFVFMIQICRNKIELKNKFINVARNPIATPRLHAAIIVVLMCLLFCFKKKKKVINNGLLRVYLHMF